ncbi:hypothetical protein QBC34DRAFT_387491 [Podospora aff. communis PSN243]|uniref:Zn(2)-C6 fungal-type domain-containing protein n=1 Tax=Podospora aff. communis PSN243 TaxID=3040156 RepID=A0AAV9G470_9PEZI|nr:hypothetical protein QBC34DRAFT_387491 [Podospora aff. communis PSN243]
MSSRSHRCGDYLDEPTRPEPPPSNRPEPPPPPKPPKTPPIHLRPLKNPLRIHPLPPVPTSHDLWNPFPPGWRPSHARSNPPTIHVLPSQPDPSRPRVDNKSGPVNSNGLGNMCPGGYCEMNGLEPEGCKYAPKRPCAACAEQGRHCYPARPGTGVKVEISEWDYPPPR